MQVEVKSDMTHPSINGPMSKVLNLFRPKFNFLHIKEAPIIFVRLKVF